MIVVDGVELWFADVNQAVTAKKQFKEVAGNVEVDPPRVPVKDEVLQKSTKSNGVKVTPTVGLKLPADFPYQFLKEMVTHGWVKLVDFTDRYDLTSDKQRGNALKIVRSAIEAQGYKVDDVFFYGKMGLGDGKFTRVYKPRKMAKPALKALRIATEQMSLGASPT